MSSIQIQFLDLAARHAVYAANEPEGALTGSAKGKAVSIAGTSRGLGQATAGAFAKAGAGRDVGWALTGDPIMADLVAMAMDAAWVTVAAEGFLRKGFCGLDLPPPRLSQ